MGSPGRSRGEEGELTPVDRWARPGPRAEPCLLRAWGRQRRGKRRPSVLRRHRRGLVPRSGALHRRGLSRAFRRRARLGRLGRGRGSGRPAGSLRGKGRRRGQQRRGLPLSGELRTAAAHRRPRREEEEC